MLRFAGCSAPRDAPRPPAQRAGNGCSKCTSAALRRPLRTAAGGAPAPAAGRGWSRTGGSSPGQRWGMRGGAGDCIPRVARVSCRLDRGVAGEGEEEGHRLPPRSAEGTGPGAAAAVPWGPDARWARSGSLRKEDPAGIPRWHSRLSAAEPDGSQIFRLFAAEDQYHPWAAPTSLMKALLTEYTENLGWLSILGTETRRHCLCSQLQASSESAPHPEDLPFGIFGIWHFFRDEFPVLLLMLLFIAGIQLFNPTVKSKLGSYSFLKKSPHGD